MNFEPEARRGWGRVLVVAALVGLLLGLWAGGAHCASLTVTWQANTETDLAGYRIYCGTASGQYGVPVKVDAATKSYQLTGLAPKTAYWVALTAFNLAGFESGFSDEATATTLSETKFALAVQTSAEGGGTVSPASGDYYEGTQVMLKATPAAGYAFDHWGGAVSSKDNPLAVTMTGSKSITAFFSKLPARPVGVKAVPTREPLAAPVSSGL